MNSVMNFCDFNVWVRLGCSPEEQAFIQQVRFDLEILFKETCKAEKSDLLEDSVDYVEMAKIIQETATSKNFSMIEHLCFSVFEKIELLLKNRNINFQLKIKCIKLRPPVSHLHGGVSWTCQSHM